MARKASRSERVQIVWPKTGCTAQPLKEHLQLWLDKGWKPVEADTPKEADQ